MRFLFYILSFLILSCDSGGDAPPILDGCLDIEACNYDENVTISDPEVCEYPPEYYDCDGNCIAHLDECDVCDDDSTNNCIQDCNGIWGGTAVVDECGVCDGLGAIYECSCTMPEQECGCDDIPEGDCDCNGNKIDCLGECGGSAEFDDCGVCDGDGIAEGACDCSGNVCDCSDPDCAEDFDSIDASNNNPSCGGLAVEDECGVCDANVENDCAQDCAGEWGGDAFIDECGVCCDGNTGIGCSYYHNENDYGGAYDCLGECDGVAVIDACGVCDGDAETEDDCGCENWDIDSDGVLDNYHDYEHNGSITARVYDIDGNDISSAGDMIAVFVGNEQRGVAPAMEIPEVLGGGYAFLTMIYSNETSGETLTFKYCSSLTNQILELSETIEFTPNMVEGDVTDAFVLTLIQSNCNYGLCDNPDYVEGGDSHACMPCDFIFSTSTSQGFYFFKEVMLDDELVNSDDWVGAFNEDVCVGSKQWNTELCGQGWCEVPVLGYDGSSYTEGYMETGDIPTFKIYDSSENSYIDAFPSEEIPWSVFQTPIIDLLSSSLTPSETGVSTLFIFNLDTDGNPITNLEIGDQVRLFDTEGIVNSDCDNKITGEILVGIGTWTSEQLEVVAIGSTDLCDFGGTLQQGYQEGNSMMLKVWDQSGQVECTASYTTSFGSGSFNNIFTNINAITIEACE